MWRRIGLIAITLIVVTMIVGLSITKVSYAHRVIKGVQVDTVDLSDLSKEQVDTGLNTLADIITHKQIAIKHGDNVYYFQAGELGVSLNLPATVEQVFKAGRSGSIWQQLRDRRTIKTQGLILLPILQVDKATLEKRIADKLGEIIKQPVDAGFKITPNDQVEIVPGVDGCKVDYKALEIAIKDAVNTKQGAVPVVDLPLPVLSPKRSVQDIETMGINGLIASFSTTFNPQQVGRTYNVKVAAAALDGLLLAPEDEFSFNNIVGPRSFEAGYKNALVIVNNEFVEGIGGGVCQVSSTLYNAVLLAGLKVTERSNHSIPVSYVPIGRDATVVYDALDFKFVNNQDSYIYIKSVVDSNTLTFKVYGNHVGFPRIELASQVLEEIQPRVVYEKDPSFADGQQIVKQQGAKGYRVATTRTVWQDGNKSSENLPVSYYHPVHRIIAVGTGAAAPAVVTPGLQDTVTTPPDDVPVPGADIPREQPNPASTPKAGEGNSVDRDNHGQYDPFNQQLPEEEVNHTPDVESKPWLKPEQMTDDNYHLFDVEENKEWD